MLYVLVYSTPDSAANVLPFYAGNDTTVAEQQGMDLIPLGGSMRYIARVIAN